MNTRKILKRFHLIDTTDFLLTNGVNEKDIIELMKHKEMMSEDVEVTYDKNGKAVIKFK